MSHTGSIRVLLVDDEKEFVESTAKALGRRGFETQTAGDGSEAIRLLEMISFDVLLLDVRMPGVDGSQVFQEVKRRWPSIQIVMLTGHGTEEQAQEFLQKGAAGYLNKPCEIEEIGAVLQKALVGTKQPPPKPSKTEEVDKEKFPAEPRVLLIDDETEFLASVKPPLTRRGMLVATANNAREGLDALDRLVIDVVVLDMKMPGMGGMDALRQIKKTSPLVEVVILTGHPSLEVAIEALKEGAFDFLTKPAEVESLTVKIREAYQRRLGKTTEEYKRRMEEFLKLRRE